MSPVGDRGGYKPIKFFDFCCLAQVTPLCPHVRTSPPQGGRRAQAAIFVLSPLESIHARKDARFLDKAIDEAGIDRGDAADGVDAVADEVLIGIKP